MYHQVSLKQLRPQLPQIIQQVDNSLERFVICKRGAPVAVLLSYDDFESILETLDELLDKQGLARIKKALAQAKHGQTISWEKAKAQLSFNKADSKKKKKE